MLKLWYCIVVLNFECDSLFLFIMNCIKSLLILKNKGQWKFLIRLLLQINLEQLFRIKNKSKFYLYAVDNVTLQSRWISQHIMTSQFRLQSFLSILRDAFPSCWNLKKRKMHFLQKVNADNKHLKTCYGIL